MLSELIVRDLGVIEHAQVVFGPGMTVLTGETGAGKTVLVGAIELLLGGKADGGMVRAGQREARVDGRFVTPEGVEHVLTRVVPSTGRSRAYLDGNPATVSALTDLGIELVDLHGQHAHQSLLSPKAQREALDGFGGVDRGPLREARARLREIDSALTSLGGDSRARARELDLLRFQVAEIQAANLSDSAEEVSLRAEEEVLADAVAHQEAAARGIDGLTGDGGAIDTLGSVVSALTNRSPYSDVVERLRNVSAEMADCVSDLRSAADAIEPNPERLEAIRLRRAMLRELRRKYGDTLGSVIDYLATTVSRVDELESHDARASSLDRERTVAIAALVAEAGRVKAARQATAPLLAEATQDRLRELAMPKARIDITVGADSGSSAQNPEASGSESVDDGSNVEFLIAANPGSQPAPLAKAASGGELARTMLALRLALLETGQARAGRGPWTLIFDEVDAGIGGATALAVGRALAALAGDRQVLVVTHLPQVAAFADTHALVAKQDVTVKGVESTTTTVAIVSDTDRVVELSRMLAGRPDSDSARSHAEELLAGAKAERQGKAEPGDRGKIASKAASPRSRKSGKL
jgi:DNA repair protein RecN (Recombination protein N)